MEMKSYIVYVKLNPNGYISAVNSSDFLTDLTGWVEIDSGFGDRYHHAQGNYFPDSIYTEDGMCRYKLLDGKVELCSAEEIALQKEERFDGTEVTLEERVGNLETDSSEMREALEMILQGVTE